MLHAHVCKEMEMSLWSCVYIHPLKLFQPWCPPNAWISVSTIVSPGHADQKSLRIDMSGLEKRE